VDRRYQRGIKASEHETPSRLRKQLPELVTGRSIGRAASVGFGAGAGEGGPGVGKRECSAHDILKLAGDVRAAAARGRREPP
jgi:hypothetical protein